MSTLRYPSRRAGVSLLELLVALTLLGFIGASILRTFTSQARLAELHTKRLDARAVSRAPINLVMSEARMVETGQGVVAASASSLTLRVPVAMGVVCGISGTETVVSLLPVDSAVVASAEISGHAYRQANGAYAYTEGATTVAAGGDATCTAEQITAAPGGRTVLVTPQMAAAEVGTVGFLYQRVRYDFMASATFAGRMGLWRTLEPSGATEEVAAPFDPAARFRYYRADQDTVDTAVPALGQIRGFALELRGASEHARFGKTAPESTLLRTAVFFMNRLN
jgi:Tfp pilus assembly protein PilX